MDETGTKATTDIELKMSKANYSLSNRALSQDLGVSENTVGKYRRIYGSQQNLTKDMEIMMAKADYSLPDKELIYLLKVSSTTVSKYRRIYAPNSNSKP